LTFYRAPYAALATALLLQNFINLFQIKDVCFLLNRENDLYLLMEFNKARGEASNGGDDW
jgi:hypothetical protein